MHVCVPVMKRYDLLEKLIYSLNESEQPPAHVWIIDNGRDAGRTKRATRDCVAPLEVYRPNAQIGLAAAWNWFIENTPGERLITNDDIIFAPYSLEQIFASQADFVSCGFGFSCFMIRDACVKRVGFFDETISPGYAYFEDMDYYRRMRLEDIDDAIVMCDVIHAHSATPQRYSESEWHAHHKKFLRAQMNYEAKWGAANWDQLKTVGGAGANA